MPFWRGSTATWGHDLGFSIWLILVIYIYIYIYIWNRAANSGGNRAPTECPQDPINNRQKNFFRGMLLKQSKEELLYFGWLDTHPIVYISIVSWANSGPRRRRRYIPSFCFLSVRAASRSVFPSLNLTASNSAPSKHSFWQLPLNHHHHQTLPRVASNRRNEQRDVWNNRNDRSKNPNPKP
jgi:hypothetical protein